MAAEDEKDEAVSRGEYEEGEQEEEEEEAVTEWKDKRMIKV